MEAQNNNPLFGNNDGQVPGGNAQAQQNPPGPQPVTQISAAEWAAKFPTKRATYNFLAVECDVYLPPIGK